MLSVVGIVFGLPVISRDFDLICLLQVKNLHDFKILRVIPVCGQDWEPLTTGSNWENSVW